jgi:hypothetical protein
MWISGSYHNVLRNADSVTEGLIVVQRSKFHTGLDPMDMKMKMERQNKAAFAHGVITASKSYWLQRSS